ASSLRIFRKRLQRERRNEFGRVLCHDNKHFVALFDEETGELGRFIRGDRSRDAEHGRFFSSRNAHHFSCADFFASALEIFFHLRLKLIVNSLPITSTVNAGSSNSLQP